MHKGNKMCADLLLQVECIRINNMCKIMAIITPISAKMGLIN